MSLTAARPMAVPPPRPEPNAHDGPIRPDGETHERLRPRAWRQPKSVDGILRAELSSAPITYHICSWEDGDSGTQTDHRTLAMSVCRLACVALDATRGRPLPSPVRRHLAEHCIRRLHILSVLMEHHMQAHPEQRASICRPPAIPKMMYGTLVTSAKIDAAVHLQVGRHDHWVGVVLERTGSRWVCNHLDVG